MINVPYLMKRVQKAILLSRPRFWPYTAGTYAVGYATYAEGAGTFARPEFWYGLFFFLIPANMILYGVNDWYDRDTDMLNAKKQGKELRAHSGNEYIYKAAIGVSFALCLPLFLILPAKANLALIVFLALSTAYSAPPVRFKSRPFLDSLSNALYIAPALVGMYQNTRNDPALAAVAAAAVWAAGMHLFSAIPDIEADIAAGIKTTATTLGRANSLIVCVFLWALSGTIAASFNPLLTGALLYCCLPAYLLLRPTADIHRVYWLFPYINLIAGFFLFWIVVLK